MIGKKLFKLLPKRQRKQLKNFWILSKIYGQYKSIATNSCVDANSQPCPWYTYPSIEYFNNIDFSEKSVFEYGSGFSSLYWSKRAKNVISVEHEKSWYDKIKESINPNQDILFFPDLDNYVESIKNIGKKFDVIIIDGMERLKCSQVISPYINRESPDGFMIILDNSEHYPEIAKFFREDLSLIEVDFHGFGPINDYTWTTSVFLSRNFNFKPVGKLQPVFPLGYL